ncbi:MULTISPECIES: hypothetical protein [unclassified Streptomyces]|nr:MULTISPECIES: hypothetical protein [unclassified Streptomyces]
MEIRRAGTSPGLIPIHGDPPALLDPDACPEAGASGTVGGDGTL